MRTELYVVALVLLLAACSDRPAGNDPLTFNGTGCYECCFEASTFVADRPSKSEFWHVEAPPKSFDEQFLKLAGGKQGHRFAVSVKVHGTLSPPGQYGHFGGSSRALEIVEFSDMRAHPEGACNVIQELPPVPPNNSLQRP